ncbi:MAG: aldehyde dehydrogenase family protein [Tepidisphaeraceae bacterium]
MPSSIESPDWSTLGESSPGEPRPVLIAGEWRAARAIDTFTATNPKTGRPIPGVFPVSAWPDLELALRAASNAAAMLRALPDVADRLARFLEDYAVRIEANASEIIAAAAEETGLALSPRLGDIELLRTTDQLRQASRAARDCDWQRPTIDTKAGLRSCLAPVGPVLVMGPNNFPLAFNGISGGDFAAAIAAGNPVIAKAHPLHPNTSRLLAEAAHRSATAAGLPPGTVQMVYHTAVSDGLRMVRDERLAAVAFTGGRPTGLKLKAEAESAGTQFFGELSSINPTVLLPGALEQHFETIVDQFVASVLMGTGQFCTKPGLVLLTAGEQTECFIRAVANKLAAAPAGVLFSAAGLESLAGAVRTWIAAGAQPLTGGSVVDGDGFRFQNTLVRATAKQFLGNPKTLQTEAFGNAAMVVVAAHHAQLLDMIRTLEGSLTGTIYSAINGADDDAYASTATALRPKVGRLINDKMPTGVAVSPAMNHGGPFPASTQPHFSAVGLPGSISRFTQLQSYDNVRDHRLPPCLRDRNPTGRLPRLINGEWSVGNL